MPTNFADNLGKRKESSAMCDEKAKPSRPGATANPIHNTEQEDLQSNHKSFSKDMNMTKDNTLANIPASSQTAPPLLDSLET